MRLAELLKATITDGVELTLDVSSAPPAFKQVLLRLSNLELATDDVLVALLAAAPIDQYGIYAAIRKYVKGWEFDALNISALSILAKDGPLPIAILQIDLFTGDLVFIARQEGKLVVVESLPAEEILRLIKTPGMTEERLWDILSTKIGDTVRKGTLPYQEPS